VTTTRQSPGNGYVGSYSTAAGTRWEWKATLTLPNGTRKVVHKRGFLIKTAANKALTKVLAASGDGKYAEPSKQPFGDYLAAWLNGLQHSPSTVASYRKNVRLHISPHLGTLPLSEVPQTFRTGIQ
jgi:Phage integrase, N-terminal SAM-like domain